MFSRLSLIFILILSSAQLNANDLSRKIKCGYALGYPPYQYVNANQQPSGTDIEMAKKVFKAAGLEVEFIAGEWEQLLSNLIHKTGKVDALCGAEINEKRSALVDFTEPFYFRHNTLFVLHKSPIYKIQDLYGKFVAGDRDSFFEKSLNQHKSSIRITRTASKEESFKSLRDQKIVAAIAPEEVGHYFANSLNIRVRTIGPKDPGSPVAFAVAKGNVALKERLNKALRKLKANK